MIQATRKNGEPITQNETGWKIVEVSMQDDGKPRLHMSNISKPAAHTACCGRDIANVTGIPASYWAHSKDEYEWCEQCERRMLRIARQAGKALPVSWLGKP